MDHLTALLLSLVIPVQLDRLTCETAQTLEGRIVLASAVVSKPAYTWKGFTVIGAADLPDGTERTIVLPGNQLAALREGQRVKVLGRVEVIRHPSRQVGRELVPAWIEVRVEASN